MAILEKHHTNSEVLGLGQIWTGNTICLLGLGSASTLVLGSGLDRNVQNINILPL